MAEKDLLEARAVDVSEIERMIEGRAVKPGGPFTAGRIVNVLDLNLALDDDLAAPAASQ